MRYFMVFGTLFVSLMFCGCGEAAKSMQHPKSPSVSKVTPHNIEPRELTSLEKRLLSNTENKTIYLVPSLETHTSYISDMLVTKDGVIVTASLDKTIHLYNEKNPHKIRTILGEISQIKGAVEHIALNPQGDLLAVSGDFPLKPETLQVNVPLRIYNFKTGVLLGNLEKHKSKITALCFSSDGKYLLSADEKGNVFAWDTKKMLTKGYTPFQPLMEKQTASKIKISSTNQLYLLDKKHFSIALYKKIFPLRSADDFITPLDLKNPHVHMIDFALNTQDIAIVTTDNEVFIYDKDISKKSLHFDWKLPFRIGQLAYTKDGKFLAVCGENHFALFDAQHSYKEIYTTSFPFGKSVALASTDKKFIIANAHQDIFSFSIANKSFQSVLKRYDDTIDNIAFMGDTLQLEIHNKYKYLDLKTFTLSDVVPQGLSVTHWKEKTSFQLQLEGKKRIVVIKNGFIVTKIETINDIKALQIYDKYILVGDATGAIVAYDLFGHIVAKFLAHQSAIKTFILQKGKMISLDTNGIVYIWNLKLLDFSKYYLIGINANSLSQKVGARVCDSKWKNEILPSLTIFKNDIKYQSKFYDKYRQKEQRKISFYDFISPSFGLFMIHNEYILWNNDNYFMASTNGAKYMSFYLNNGYSKEAESISMNRLYDYFFRPDLIQLSLDEKDITPFTHHISYKDVLQTPPPRVVMQKISPKDINRDKRTLRFSFKVQENGNGGIGVIRIYQEGKLVKTFGEGTIKRVIADADRHLQEEKLNQLSLLKQKEYLSKKQTDAKSVGEVSVEDLVEDVSLSTDIRNKEGKYSVVLPIKAGNNSFSVEAFNKTNSVASMRETLTCKVDLEQRTPTVYAIVAGVNHFEQANVNDLHYSQNDADSIAQEIRNATPYKTEIISLLGKDVTKEKLYQAIEDIRAKAHLEDKIIFYISTHGKAIRGNLYLVPFNNKSAKNWISFSELFQKIQQIAALEQIFIIDACESGTASDIMASVYDAKASVLAKQSGIHLLMATTKGTFAFESKEKEVHHGVFTNNILKALHSKATDKNKDKTISVIELSKTIQEKEYRKEAQFPVIRNVGEDTMVKVLHN